MSNYIEGNHTIAFHLGYYIQGLVEESGLSQEDFSKRLGITPENLSVLIRIEQALSKDESMKIFNMTGTSVDLW